MKRYGRSGWFGQSHRHYLAAKGISTKRYFANPDSPRRVSERLGKRIGLMRDDDDLWDTAEGRRREKRWRTERLEKLKKWAKEQGLSDDDEIVVVDGENGGGVVGFEYIPPGPNVSWDMTLGEYIREEEEELESRDELIEDLEDKQQELTVSRLSKTKMFGDTVPMDFNKFAQGYRYKRREQ